MCSVSGSALDFGSWECLPVRSGFPWPFPVWNLPWHGASAASAWFCKRKHTESATETTSATEARTEPTKTNGTRNGSDKRRPRPNGSKTHGFIVTVPRLSRLPVRKMAISALRSHLAFLCVSLPLHQRSLEICFQTPRAFCLVTD